MASRVCSLSFDGEVGQKHIEKLLIVFHHNTVTVRRSLLTINKTFEAVLGHQ